MSTVTPQEVPQNRWAKSPFYFNSSASLLKVGREKANTLGEMLEGIRCCPDASIFQHTFQTLSEHHFIREGYSNDFAHWAFAACNEAGLAERLAAVDIREFTSIVDLRNRLLGLFEDYLAHNPRARERVAFEPFFFCESEVVVIPTPFVARNLQEFANGMARVSPHSLHYHFIQSRLRLKLSSNDFSEWITWELDLPKLAEQVDRIDIYTSTLEDVRRVILRLVEEQMES